jgi:phage tail-like protein
MAVVTQGPAEDVEYVGSWFSVELGNGITGNFTEASGLSMDIEVVTIIDAAKDTVTRKRPGQASYGDITLKRTLSADKSFWEWCKKIRDGDKKYRTDGAIVLHDMAGDEIGRWQFSNAWPSNWSASDLDVGSDDPIIETVKLEIELLERKK